MRSRWTLIVWLIALAGCGRSEPAFAPGVAPPLAERPVEEEEPPLSEAELAGRTFFLAGATRRDQLYVVRVVPELGRVVAFGPALPQVSLATHRLDEVHVRPGRAAAVVELAPREAPGPRFVMYGDGRGWTVLSEHARSGSDYSARTPIVSPEMSWVFVEALEDRGGFDFHAHTELVSIDGRRRVLDEDTTETPTTPVAFSPDDAWVLVRRGTRAEVLRRDGGAELFREGVAPTWGAQDVAVSFPTSVILEERGAWLDLAGRPIAVRGYVPAALSNGYQVVDGTLFGLEDRNVRAVQDLGRYGPAFPWGHGPVGALISATPRRGLHVVREGREVAAYTVPPNTLAPPLERPEISVYADVAGWRATEERLVALVHLHYDARTASQGFSFEDDLEAWTVFADGTSKTQRLVTQPTSYLPVIQLSPDGRWALWIADGEAHLADLEGGTSAALSGAWGWPEQAIIPRSRPPAF